MMPRKPKSRLRSLRGRKIGKEVAKETLMRDANLKYLRSHGVVCEDGQRVGLAARSIRESPIKDNNASCKGTFTKNENLDPLTRGPNKSKERSTFLKLKNHLPSSKNLKDTRRGDKMYIEEKVQVPSKLKATPRGTTNVESLRSTSRHNQSISRPLETTQRHMQRDHSLMNDVSGNVNVLGSLPSNIYPLEDGNVECSEVVRVGEFAPFEETIECSRQPQFKAMEHLVHKKKNINGVTKFKACPSKVMTSEQRYIEIDEDESGDVNSKNSIGDDTNGSKEVDGGNKNLTCEAIKEETKTKRDIESDDTDKSQVVQDDCGGDIRTRFSTKMNNEATNDKGVRCLMGIDGNIGDVKSNSRKESTQERTDVTLGGGDSGGDDDSEEVVWLTSGANKKRSRYIVTSSDEVVEMESKVTNDRNVECLIGINGKIGDVKSNARKELMQEKTNVTLGGCGDNDDDSEEVVWLTSKQKKKRRNRYIVTSDDDDVDDVDPDGVGIEGRERAKSKAKVMLMDCHGNVPMPYISECVEQQCYCCSKPIDEAVWRGTLKIDGNEYTSLVAHLSTKCSEKVWKLSRSLQTSIEVMKHSRSKFRPKIWGSSKPSDDNIGLYFFPNGMRHDANLDQLINEVMENDLVLQAVIGEVEMLIFPSCLLPERYKTFQRKHYLWALFKKREDKFAVAAKPLDGSGLCAQEEEKGKEHVSNQQDGVDDVEPSEEMILMKSAIPVESELVNSHLCIEKQGSEGIARGGMDDLMNCNSPPESTQQVSASCIPGVSNICLQFKAPNDRNQEDARGQSVHAAEATATAAANSPVIIAEATARATNAANISADREQLNSSMGDSPCLYLFVARQTPRVEQILKELDREVGLVFAKTIGAGTGPGSIATTMQL